MNGRACWCGMPNAWGLPWRTWHRLHVAQHRHAFPHLDDRTIRNLRELAQK